MIRWVNSVGAQCNDLHVHYVQRAQEWGPPQCTYYGSVKHNDPSALSIRILLAYVPVRFI